NDQQIETLLAIQRRVYKEQREVDEEGAEQRRGEPRGRGGGGERRKEIERQEMKCAPFLFDRHPHQRQQNEIEEEGHNGRDRDQADVAGLHELIRECAPELAGGEVLPIEREQLHEFRRILKLQQKEGDVHEQQHVDRSEVLAAVSEHGG